MDYFSDLTPKSIRIGFFQFGAWLRFRIEFLLDGSILCTSILFQQQQSNQSPQIIYLFAVVHLLELCVRIADRLSAHRQFAVSIPVLFPTLETNAVTNIAIRCIIAPCAVEYFIFE